MPTMKDIFEVEKNREDASQWNVIHLFREGSTYKAYEWSAWLCREHGTTDEHLQQVGAKRLNPVHRNVKNTGGSVIFVGFPFASIDKFLPKTKITESKQYFHKLLKQNDYEQNVRTSERLRLSARRRKPTRHRLWHEASV